MLPELDCGTSGFESEPRKQIKDIDVFLTHIIITKDDILRYADRMPECKNVGLKNPIIVDIYI